MRPRDGLGGRRRPRRRVKNSQRARPELLARLRAAVRRASATTDGEPVLIAGDLTIDLAAPIRSLTVPPTNCG